MYSVTQYSCHGSDVLIRPTVGQGWEWAVVCLVSRLQPDMVVFTGDPGEQSCPGIG